MLNPASLIDPGPVSSGPAMTGVDEFQIAQPPGVVILGVEYQALGLLRQLSTSGVRCVLVDQDEWGASRFSRYCSAFFQSPPYESEQFWPWLIERQEREGWNDWLLIATDDEQVRQIALNIEEARSRFRYAGPAWNVYQSLYNKRLTYKWCQQQRVRQPQSYFPRTRDDLPGGSLEYPFIVKPAFKRNFKRYSKAKAIVVNSDHDLRMLLEGPLAAVEIDELIYQEIIPGGGEQQWSYAGFFIEGDPVAAFTACRRRQHPPDFGRASTYVVAEYNAEVEQESRKLLAALKYTGLAEVEWKRDPRNGDLKFLEVNTRAWGWHSLSSRVLGNLPRMLYDSLCGQEVKPVTPRYGARWVKHMTDIPVVFDLWRRGDLTLREYLKSLSGDVTSCEWDWRDPAPFLLQFFLLPYLIKRRGY
jgi:predicted ATP-grasp superfamily ATP-dependent carboligase